ncbi:MAG: PEP-utilizing enzyme [Candidatus Moranbacteria bacterium]|nr:PEP-utilizing enzyme [Candidatus Moranbacteria bacterium]
MVEKKFEFIADRNSGIEGSIYGLSMCLEVIWQSNLRNSVKFPFYAQIIDDKKQQCTEWIDAEAYRVNAFNFLRYSEKNGTDYLKSVSKQVTEETADFFTLSATLLPTLRKLSDFDLAEAYGIFMNRYNEIYGLGALTYVYEHDLSEHLSQSFGKRGKNATAFLSQILKTDYKSFVFESDELLLAIKSEKKAIVKQKLINSYLKSFYFMRATYSSAPILDSEGVLRMAAEREVQEKFEKEKNQKPIELTVEEKVLVSILQETEIIRDQRKKANLIGMYMMFRFLDELCKRSGISSEIARRMFWYEFIDGLFDTERLLAILKKRTQVSIVFDGSNTYYLEYAAIRPRQIRKNVTQFKGTPASSGKVSAKVRIVLGSNDFEKFKRGEVLVTQMTRPAFLPLMKIAAAIVTDEGGLTCHAAIIARELHIPCIVGTKIATQVLKDGDLVEVDAEKGFVRILQ